MGVKSATKTKFVGKGLTLKTIQSFNLGNRIDVDGNALVYTFIGNGRKNLAEILSEMASHLKQLAYSGGFIVTVIFDGDSLTGKIRWASWQYESVNYNLY